MTSLADVCSDRELFESLFTVPSSADFTSSYLHDLSCRSLNLTLLLAQLRETRSAADILAAVSVMREGRREGGRAGGWEWGRLPSNSSVLVTSYRRHPTGTLRPSLPTYAASSSVSRHASPHAAWTPASTRCGWTTRDGRTSWRLWPTCLARWPPTDRWTGKWSSEERSRE